MSDAALDPVDGAVIVRDLDTLMRLCRQCYVMGRSTKAPFEPVERALRAVLLGESTAEEAAILARLECGYSVDEEG